MKIIIEQSDFHAIAEAISQDWGVRKRIEATVGVLARHIDNTREHSVDSLMVGSIASVNATREILKELIVQILVGVEIVTERGSHIKHKEILHAITLATKEVNEIFTDTHKMKVIEMLYKEKQDFEDFKRVRHSTKVEEVVKKGSKKKS